MKYRVCRFQSSRLKNESFRISIFQLSKLDPKSWVFSLFDQNYQYRSTMQQFQKIFRKAIQSQQADTKTPVVHAIQDFFTTHQDLIASANSRRLTIQHKNQLIAEESLRYRSNLQEKIDLEQTRHKKKRQENLKKIQDTEGRKDKYVKEINLKFKEEEKSAFKQRLQSFKQNQDKMEKFWTERRMLRQTLYRSQSAAKPLYDESVDRKRFIEMRQSDFGLNSKVEMLKRHAGREHLIYRQVQDKQESIHNVHNQQIIKNIQRHQEIVQARENKFINDIGHSFEVSGEVLSQKKKNFESKLKGKLIDEDAKRFTVRSNFLQKNKSRSASLASCRCKRINNVEEGITKSIILQEKTRGSFFTQTLRDHEKSPNSLMQQRRNFLVRSQSMRSTVSNNQQSLRQRKFEADSERLQREKKISDALALKKALEVEGNCYVRLINVK